MFYAMYLSVNIKNKTELHQFRDLQLKSCKRPRKTFSGFYTQKFKILHFPSGEVDCTKVYFVEDISILRQLNTKDMAFCSK